MKNMILEALAEEFATGNKLVKFKPTSPLAFVSTRDMRVEFGSEGSSLIDLSSEEKEAELDKIAAQLSNTLVGEIAYYREVVKPYIEDAYENVMRAVTEAMKAPAINLDVVFVTLPSWLTTTELKDRIKMQAGTEPNEVSTFVKIPTIKNEDMIQLAMTTDGALSQQIAEWMKNIDRSTLEDIWNKWFVDGKVYNNPMTVRYEAIDELAAVWAWANAMSMEDTDLPDGISATSMQFKNFIGAVVRNLAYRIKNTIEYIERARRIETITLGVREDSNTVFVDRAVFDRWASDGGNMDLIFGWWVTPNRPRVLTIPNARERAEEFMSNFRKQTELAAKSRQIKISGIIADTLEAAYRIFRSNPHESVMKVITGNQKRWEQLKKQFQEFIANVRKRDYMEAHLPDHVASLTTKVVTTYFFPHTNAGSFFFKLKDVMDRNPEMDADTASKFAAVYLIAEYVASQTTLEEVVVQN